MTPLNLPFDIFDWICGLLINGVLAFFLLAAITAAGRPLWGILVTASVFVLSIGSAALVKLLLQAAASPDYLATASYRRRALLTWMPWPLGIVATCMVILGCVHAMRWVDERRRRKKTLETFGPQLGVRKALHEMLARDGQDASCGLPCLHNGGVPCTRSGRCEVRAIMARRPPPALKMTARKRRRIFWDT
jgi:hypothetical protein